MAVSSNEPQVSISVASAPVIENTASKIVYKFTRTGDLSTSLSVNFAVSGTANSADYTSSVGYSTGRNLGRLFNTIIR